MAVVLGPAAYAFDTSVPPTAAGDPSAGPTAGNGPGRAAAGADLARPGIGAQLAAFDPDPEASCRPPARGQVPPAGGAPAPVRAVVRGGPDGNLASTAIEYPSPIGGAAAWIVAVTSRQSGGGHPDSDRPAGDGQWAVSFRSAMTVEKLQSSCRPANFGS